MKFSKLAIAAATATALSFDGHNAFACPAHQPGGQRHLCRNRRSGFRYLITSKVKSSLIANKNVSGVDIKVETNKGVVPFPAT